jgi:hypothetical protein
VARLRDVTKLLGASALIVLPVVGLVTGPAVFLWLGRTRSIMFDINGSDNPRDARAFAVDWGALAVRHLHHQLAAPLTCSTPGAKAVDARFRLVCTGKTVDGLGVTLLANSSRITEARNQSSSVAYTQYLSGP